tara:strand:+ start:18234 stop:18509 length:276 start_codon:yes stop_codon:yes gene_type:complete
MTTYPKFKLTIGYRSWLMDAASAAKVMDTLAGAISVDSDWVDGEGIIHVLDKPETLSLEQVSRRVLTPVQYIEALEEARAARAAKEAAEQA